MKIKRITLLLMAVLTAKIGTIGYHDHRETWYDLPMTNVIERADQYYGQKGEFAIREDGVKTYNGFVIVATDWEKYPYGSTVETTLGIGVVLDAHTAKNKNLVDVATAWKGGTK